MNRERITITLKKDLLKLLDGSVDGKKIRNRSHAVEFLLAQQLYHAPTPVLILAGGKGAGLPHLPSDTPKALIPFRGKPLLEYTLERLKGEGLTEVFISIGQHGQKIKEYFGDGSRFGMRLTYIEQSLARRGTAQPVKQAQSLLEGDTFLLLYGDVLTNLSYSDLIEFHLNQKNAVATMALASAEHPMQWGVAKLTGSRIVEFEEKPRIPSTHSHLVNAGVYVLSQSVFRYIAQDSGKLESEMFPRLAEEGKLAGYPFEGVWYDVSSPAMYRELLKETRV